jgi:eukaryotic-like serine/threonine-protein kinase
VGEPLAILAPDPLIGRTIAGKYAVRDVIAKGGMGVIYRAEQMGLGRIVALKMLHTSRERDAMFEQRFSLEAATLAKLKHPNTVTVFDYGFSEPEAMYFMAMEYVEGNNLARIVKTEGALAPSRALKIIYECSRALHEAHSLGIVHRDLKPANIMISGSSEGENIKVLDFGIAKLIEPDPDRLDLTDDQTMLGSPKFMAPEQIRKGSAIDARTDVYSLGAVLYYLLAGIEPFTGDTQVQVLMAHLASEVPSLAERGATNVPAQVEAIARKCLAKEQADRYATMDELKIAIRGVLGELEAGNTNPTLSRRIEFTGEASRGSQLPLGMIAAALALLSLGAIVLAIVIVGVLGVGMGVASVPSTPEASPPVEVVAPAPVVVVPVVEAPPRTPQLTITSEPSSATVYEGDAPLGTTPLTLDWAAAPDPRSLELRLDGYQPAKFDLGAIDADTRQHVPLVKIAKVNKPVTKVEVKPPDATNDDLILER